uniref:chromatin modification-related protein EAF1 B-like isoform X2 n=1 Tax=Erigeron canadensis TaxID=72917 RepID=UPI001CB9A160|nr:chromatin modification-related protein EAF1 B-like isoform X2 [Erigeron canadensis]
MGGDIDGRLEVSSTLPLQQLLDLEKTQAELRQTFNVAEKFRRELEYLQKGGNPLDLICGDGTSVSGQSTSLAGHHLEQFVASDTKGNFGVTASSLNDSVGSSGRLGGHLVCDPNSADNLVLFDGNNKFPKVERRSIAPLEHYSQLHSGQHAMASGDSVALEVPKKSYKRRNRSRPIHDGARLSPSRDVKELVVAAAVALNDLSSINSKIKGSTASVTIKNLDSNSRLDTDILAVETTVGQIQGSSFTISTGSHNFRRNQHNSTKGFDSESSCSQNGQSLDVNNDNKLPTSPGNINRNGKTDQILATNEVKEGNELVKETDCTVSKNFNCNFDICYGALNEDNSVIKEVEGLKSSESPLQNGSKNLVSAEGVNPDGFAGSETERKPCDRPQDSVDTSESKLSVRAPNDVSEQPVNSQDNLNLPPRAPNDVSEQPANSQNLYLGTEVHEDYILKEAQIIEEKHKRMSELCLSTLSLQSHQISHWDFVLGEMAWLANDFAQERLWKLTAAAQFSRRAAFASHVRFQRQISLWKQKEVAQILGRDVMEFWYMTEEKCKDLELQCLKTDSKQGLQGYVMRFLKYNSVHAHCSTEHVSSTPDLISDVGTIGWDDNWTQENLVYTVPHGAVEAYRKSIESHLLRFERTWNGLQEEVDTSKCDAVAVDAYEDKDGATRVYDLARESERSKESNDSEKSEKNFKFNAARSYEMGADLPFMQSIGKNIDTQPSVLSGKRSGSSLNVSVTTNHVHTASRQRIVGSLSALNKTDASSDETNSFQDEHSGGAHMPNNIEAQSLGDYEKQLWFDSVEVSDRPRKIKKARHQGFSYKHRWQFDSGFQNDKKDHLKRRLDVHQLDNGSNGLYIQHNVKKMKIRQSSNDIRPFCRSVSSPMTSKMINMSNPKKFMELLVRDGRKKSKTLKMQAGQPGSGSLWSLFEDQFLIVLVHDMGPNWELISDITNSNLQFKCIFRSSNECKERHKVLMDRSTGDRADSAEDSESGQPYSSMLPGIPEGSARQLFQRLQGPMEEETLKSHFEKIIVIGKKQYNRRKQKHSQDPKQLQPPHSSFKLALSQVSPNNLNGGDVLTPFDLCDAPLDGCQNSHNGGLQVLDQGNEMSMLPGSSTSSFVSGSSTLASGNEFSSASVLNPSIRDGRYGIPRKGLLPKDDPQRTHQYNHMLSSRTNTSPGSHLAMGRGIPMLSSGNNVGVISAVNRGMPMARPAFHGIPSMPSTVSMHSRAVPGQGSSISRPHNGMYLMRPNHNQNTDHQRKIPPVSQGQSSRVVSQFVPNISHPGFEMRIVKERKLKQQRDLQHQQFATSNAMIPLVQSPKSHLPVTSPQTSIEIQSREPPLLPPHENMLNSQTGGNQILKQQYQSHNFKQHQQKAHSSQVQAKLQQQKPDNSKHQNHVPSLLASPSIMPRQKLVNLSHLASPKKMLKNELVNSSEEPLTSSKLQASPPQTRGTGDSSEPV